jgi:pimeloyl-ACP methyl ester carboxylesterase
VHGLGCAGEDWDRAIADLSRSFACLSLDLPGHGESAMPAPERATIEGLAAAVGEIVAEIGADRIVLVGHSLGTKVIRACYRQSPVAIGGLILVDGSTYSGNAKGSIEKLQADVAHRGFTALREGSSAGMFGAGMDSAVVARITSRSSRLDRNLAISLLTDSIRWDTQVGDDVLRSLRCPLLLVQSTYYTPGTGRVFMTPAMQTPLMTKVAQLVRASECQIMTGVGHFPMIERPAEVAAMIKTFVRAGRHGPS